MALTEKLASIADAVRSVTGGSEKLTLAEMAREVAHIYNFTVCAGSRPASPAENTIWVDTGELTGYVFSAAEPAGTAGLVWFETALTSPAEFNALKKDTLLVCPMAVKQFTGGAWVSRTAEIYRGGGWTSVLSTVYLFKAGEGQKVNFTKKLNNTGSGYDCSITDSAISATSYINDGEADYVSVCTTAKQDLTGYSTLWFDVKVTKAWGGEEPTFGVASAAIPASETGISKFTAKKTVDVSSRKSVSVDISSISSGYVGMWGCGNFTVYNIWME